MIFGILTADANSLFERPLKFNLGEKTIGLGLHDSTVLANQEWIYINKSGQRFDFNANVAHNFTNLPNVIYTGTIPTPDALYFDYLGDYFPKMDANIVCQWDEADLTLISTNEVIKGYLLDTPDFNEYPVEDDEDTYAFIPSCRNYCIELSTSSNVKMSVRPVPGDFSEIYLSTTDLTYDQSIPSVKRFYKNDWNIGQTYHIKIHGLYNTLTYNRNRHYYKFVIKNVRPIVLVHGLSEGPTNRFDTSTAFGSIKSNIGMMAGMQPITVYDFPWDSSLGSYQQYCNGTNSLYSCIQNSTNYFLKPLVITHSFGATLVLKQIESNSYFLPMVGKFIFLAPSFCGSDHSLSTLAKFYTGTSQENLYYARNGTENIWALLKNIPQAFFDIASSYVIGLDNMGLGGVDNDGVITASSAALPNIMNEDGDIIYLDLNDKNISNITFPCDAKHQSIFELIKEYAED